MRPLTRTSPVVGAVTRDNTFSNVLLPAPFRPIMPRISPCLTSKETSRKAHISSSRRDDEGEGRGERGEGAGPSSLFALRSSLLWASPTFAYGSGLPRVRWSQRLKSWRHVWPPGPPARDFFS